MIFPTRLGIVCASKSDTDGDNVYDYLDNCLNIPNPDQRDTDQDEQGDVCDNCPEISNFDQIDTDNEGKGDACDLCLCIVKTSSYNIKLF